MNLLFAWRRVLPRLAVVDVPGEHDNLLDAQHAARLAQAMSQALRT
jgi:thioesterase domain-containing protein